MAQPPSLPGQLTFQGAALHDQLLREGVEPSYALACWLRYEAMSSDYPTSEVFFVDGVELDAGPPTAAAPRPL